MEPDKFEKHIKDQLNKREISPSENTWDKISDQLQKPESPKSNKYYWYSVAAVFIGILIISSFYFNTSDETIESGSKTVETPNDTNRIPKKEILVLEENVADDKLTNDHEAILEESDRPNEKMATTINGNSQIAILDKSNGQVIEDNVAPNQTEKLIDAKIAEIVAQVDLMENKNLPISNAEVDSLLRKAQNEILADKIFSKEGKVDAMALLNEVEGELDKSFRGQIFESLKTGFLKVRTAVADRNN
ncbi:MAG: hypothetical protein GY931_10465 [Maribacter sp.]|nr:hypothetical protein [Maribacter sp.]